jgi:hypothetical protein
MRTFPKALAALQKVVREKGEKLRNLGFDELKQAGSSPTEHVVIQSHPATISVIVLQAEDDLRVVVQGFMEARFLPGKHVAADGFYKHPDGSVTPMAGEELYEFD